MSKCLVWRPKLRLILGPLLLLVAGSEAAEAGDIEIDGKFVSSVSTGTAPLEVDSTTLVKNLNAEFLSGLPASAFSTDVSNIVRVGMTQGDFTSIQAALDSITDAGIDNLYVVLVGPGVFDETITLKNFVSVIGHGDIETRVRSVGTGNITAVQGAPISFLSDIWVQAESTDGGTVVGLEGPILQAERVRIEVKSTAAGQAIGVRAGASNDVDLVDCEVFAQDAGINTGLYVETPAYADVQGGNIRAQGFGTPTSTNYGVRVVLGSGSSNVSLVNTRIFGGGGTVGYGVRNEAGGVGASRSTISGSGSTTAVGFYNAVSTTYTVSNSSVNADGDGTEVGFQQTAGTVILRNNTLTGGPAVDVASGAQARLAYNQIFLNLTGSGTYYCIGNYDLIMSAVACPAP